MYKKDALPLGLFLHRWSVGPIDEIGTVEDYAQAIWKAYIPAPFPSMFAGLTKFEAINQDHEELDKRTAQGVYNTQDLDPNKSGFQNVLAFHLQGWIQLGIYPSPWTPDYTGPARPITAAARASTLKCVVHEIGHYYQFACNVDRGTDDVSRLMTAMFKGFESGQTQASNFAEWFAEVFHHIATGAFSDGVKANLPPELVQLMRCAYFLSVALKNRSVKDLTPHPTGIMYQTWVGFGWRWRWYSAIDWKQKEHDGSQWKVI